jgi:DNA-directed RNA polymerase specialized sigma24 family protein
MLHPQGQFPPTRWTQVEIAARPEYSGQAKALDELLTQYLPALKTYLVAQFHLDPAQAEDVTQSFVLEKVLQRGVVAQADRRRGRFRTFLLRVLNNFFLSEQRRAEARKRAPEQGFISLEEFSDDAREALAVSGSEKFDLAFARQVIDEAVRRMREQCALANRPDIWGVFEERILKPALEGAEPLGYEPLIARFGFQSPGHASSVLITAKRMYARTLRSVVAEYASDEQAVEAELQDLQSIVAGA